VSSPFWVHGWSKCWLLNRAISVLVLFVGFNSCTYIGFSIKQSNVHFNSWSARADDVGGHLNRLLHVSMTEHPLVEADESLLFTEPGSSLELLEIWLVQRKLQRVSVVGQNPRHGVACIMTGRLSNGAVHGERWIRVYKKVSFKFKIIILKWITS